MPRVLDLIGETPLVEVTRLECGPCRLLLKLESANPSGSLKDPPTRPLIDAAENDGQLRPGAFYVNQFANPANPLAHELTTGPEMLRQMDGDIDAVVVGVGSGGMLTGLGRCMRKTSPKTEMVLADPQGSILAPLVESGK